MRVARRLLLLSGLAGAWCCAADAAELEIQNGSIKAIEHVYIARSDAADWGRDLLIGNHRSVIPPGASRKIIDLAPGMYKLRLIDEGGEDTEIEDIDLETSIKVELADMQTAEYVRPKQ